MTSYNVEQVNRLHNEAMDIAEMALIEKIQNNITQAKAFFIKAYKLESEAAFLLINSLDAEPTRSVLFRSAASIAMNFNDYRESEKMICLGLAGNPPLEIADELRDLYEQINFSRHLELRGMKLEDDELQVSIAGPEVGYGFLASSIFSKKVEVLEKLTFRTFERRSNMPFKEKGAITQKSNKIGLGLSIPRAGSFTITLKLISLSKQLDLPGIFPASEIVNDIITGLEYINNKNETELKKQISEPSYLRNFVALARNLFPDGKKINLVGLTTTQKGNQKAVALTSPANKLFKDFKIDEINDEEQGVQGTWCGQLYFADKQKNKIKLISDKNKHYEIIVPEGLMSDIVKPHWAEKVCVTGKIQKNKKILLEDINGME